EPVMLNKLIDKSENLPDINNEVMHPAGWMLHYLTGLLFIVCYWFVYRRSLKNPDAKKVILIGSISGITGIGIWKLLFYQHKKPPYNNRYGYYKQLYTAHIIFTLFALATYK